MLLQKYNWQHLHASTLSAQRVWTAECICDRYPRTDMSSWRPHVKPPPHTAAVVLMMTMFDGRHLTTVTELLEVQVEAFVDDNIPNVNYNRKILDAVTWFQPVGGDHSTHL